MASVGQPKQHTPLPLQWRAQRLSVQAEFFRAAPDHAGRVAEDLLRHFGDLDELFDALVIGREVLRPQIEIALQPPLIEDVRRHAQAGAAVDGGGAADGLAERNRNPRAAAERHRHAEIAVEQCGHVERAAVELFRRDVVALFEQHHVAAALGQFLGDGRAARARADHGDFTAHASLRSGGLQQLHR